MRTNLFAILSAFLMACGPGMIPDTDGGGQGTDAMNPGTDASSADVQMPTNCRSVTRNGANLATTCSSNTQCCSGQCFSGLCSPADIGGTCANNNDCNDSLGICMGGHCGFMPMGTPCHPGTDDRMCAGGCSTTTNTCECGRYGRQCNSQSDCCEGMSCRMMATGSGSCR